MGNIEKIFTRGTGQKKLEPKGVGRCQPDLCRALFTERISDSRSLSRSWNESKGWVIVCNKGVTEGY